VIESTTRIDNGFERDKNKRVRKSRGRGEVQLSDIKQIEEAVQSLWKNDSRIWAAYLLGSAHRGTLRPESDIDIAFMPDPSERISATDRLQWMGDLSMCLGRTVDLGVLSSSNLVYGAEAVFGGAPLFVRHDRAALYATSLLSMFMAFNENRREVINAYRV